MLKGRRRADGGDDDGGAVDPFVRLRSSAVQRPHPDGGSALGEDLSDLVCDSDGSSRLLDPLLECACDAGASAAGEPGAVEVMGDDHGVYGEGRP